MAPRQSDSQPPQMAEYEKVLVPITGEHQAVNGNGNMRWLLGILLIPILTGVIAGAIAWKQAGDGATKNDLQDQRLLQHDIGLAEIRGDVRTIKDGMQDLRNDMKEIKEGFRQQRGNGGGK